MISMALYEFTVIYKPGKDYHLADFLARLNEDNLGKESNEEDDYHDQLFAAIEFGTEDNKQMNNSDEKSTDEELNGEVNINVIAREPTSETPNE